MGTYLDYLAWRGDLTLRERPFNEVDNLILAELVYFHFDELLEEGEPLNLTISEVYQRYLALEAPRPYWNNDPTPLLAPCARSQRFGQVLVTDFVNTVDVDRGIQFSAATFHLGDGTRYVAFRGTDNSIVGWKEDLDFSYMEETPAQAEAVRYLEEILRQKRGDIRVGGHSKGGNLAIYAAAFCPIRSKHILEVYSNDGPGFNQSVAQNPRYLELLPKVKLIIPESSVVSILLTNKEEKEIIRSSAADGVRQHMPDTWLVERDHFLRSARQSAASLHLSELVTRWMERMDDQERKAFVSTLYDVIQASGLTTMEELEQDKLLSYNAILKAAAALNEEARRSIRDSVIKLAEAGKEVFWDEAQTRFRSLLK